MCNHPFPYSVFVFEYIVVLFIYVGYWIKKSDIRMETQTVHQRTHWYLYMLWQYGGEKQTCSCCCWTMVAVLTSGIAKEWLHRPHYKLAGAGRSPDCRDRLLRICQQSDLHVHVDDTKCIYKLIMLSELINLNIYILDTVLFNHCKAKINFSQSHILVGVLSGLDSHTVHGYCRLLMSCTRTTPDVWSREFPFARHLKNCHKII